MDCDLFEGGERGTDREIQNSKLYIYIIYIYICAASIFIYMIRIYLNSVYGNKELYIVIRIPEYQQNNKTNI